MEEKFPTLVRNLSVFVLSFLIKVCDFSRKPFCFCFVFLRFPTLDGNLSVFVLSFLIILYSLFFIFKVSDFSRKPFCFRFVFSYYSLFFIFLLSFPHHCPFITSSMFNRLTSNFQQMFRITRLSLLLNFNIISPEVGTGRGLQIWYSL